MGSAFKMVEMRESLRSEVSTSVDRNGLADEALGHLAAAWQALEALETSLASDLQRWDAESLMTARKGTQRAWLAVSNLNRSLCAARQRSQSVERS
jgi:hypothetical protein